MPPGRAVERSPAWNSPAHGRARSPPAPPTRGTARRAALPRVQTSLVACRLPSGTILFRQPATPRPRSQHPCLPRLRQSQPRTVDAHCALPLVVDQVTSMAPAQIDPNAAFDCSSQPPLSRCCDDRLNPPSTSRSNTPSAWPRPASSRRSAASGTATTCSRRDDQRPVQGRGYSPAGAVAHLRGGRVRYARMGRLVQQSPAPRANRQHPAGRSRETLPCHAGRHRRGRVTQTKSPPENPERFNWTSKYTRSQWDINTGVVISCSTWRVTPPNTISLSLEWP